MIKYIASIIGFIFLIILITAAGKLFENVKADEIVCIQDPVDGELHWYTEQGLKWQNLGSDHHFKKMFQYWFSEKQDQGGNNDQSIKVRFNDGGHGQVSGSVSCELPRDIETLTSLLQKYGNQQNIEQQLIRTVFEKAVYMTGPLMSSKESYAEKRNLLISYIEDQAMRGIYQTTTKDVREKDPITGVDKTRTLVEIAKDPAGNSLRVEESPLQTFKIRCYNLSINSVVYDKTVEEQIATQQKAIMDIQTAIAQSKQAEQKALTVEKEGQASAAKSKWEQEAIKAKLVTEAEQNLAVAELRKKTAEQVKLEQILLGQGEAERKRLVMEADGALQAKLDAYIKVMSIFAQEFSKQKWVPETQIVTGGSQNNPNVASEFMNILTAKALKDLNLNTTIAAQKQ